MAHHSSNPSPEFEQFFQEQAKRLHEEAQNLQFGPTGEFPEGKLVQEDEGELKLGITHHKGKVVIDFGSPVTWIGFTPEQADEIAKTLIQHASEARK